MDKQSTLALQQHMTHSAGVNNWLLLDVLTRALYDANVIPAGATVDKFVYLLPFVTMKMRAFGLVVWCPDEPDSGTFLPLLHIFIETRGGTLVTLSRIGFEPRECDLELQTVGDIVVEASRLINHPWQLPEESSA